MNTPAALHGRVSSLAQLKGWRGTKEAAQLEAGEGSGSHRSADTGGWESTGREEGNVDSFALPFLPDRQHSDRDFPCETT